MSKLQNGQINYSHSPEITIFFWSNMKNISTSRNAFRYASSWHSCDIDKDMDLHAYTFTIVTIYYISCSVNDYKEIYNAIYNI